jgi:hypothetical protein
MTQPAASASRGTVSSLEGSSSHSHNHSRAIPPYFHFVFAVALCAFHVHAGDDSSQAYHNSTNGSSNDDELDFLGRFTSGTLTKLDMVLLVALGVLSMEAVNFVSILSGGTLLSGDAALSVYISIRHFLALDACFLVILTVYAFFLTLRTLRTRYFSLDEVRSHTSTREALG